MNTVSGERGRTVVLTPRDLLIARVTGISVAGILLAIDAHDFFIPFFLALSLPGAGEEYSLLRAEKEEIRLTPAVSLRSARFWAIQVASLLGSYAFVYAINRWTTAHFSPIPGVALFFLFCCSAYGMRTRPQPSKRTTTLS